MIETRRRGTRMTRQFGIDAAIVHWNSRWWVSVVHILMLSTITVRRSITTTISPKLARRRIFTASMRPGGLLTLKLHDKRKKLSYLISLFLEIYLYKIYEKILKRRNGQINSAKTTTSLFFCLEIGQPKVDSGRHGIE